MRKKSKYCLPTYVEVDPPLSVAIILHILMLDKFS